MDSNIEWNSEISVILNAILKNGTIPTNGLRKHHSWKSAIYPTLLLVFSLFPSTDDA